MALDNANIKPKAGGARGGPRSPSVTKLIENDPGGSSKEDIYRQCLLQDVEQCNWRMRRAMKGN